MGAGITGYIVGSHTGEETAAEKVHADSHEKDEQLNDLESSIEANLKVEKKNQVVIEALKGIQDQIHQAKAMDVGEEHKKNEDADELKKGLTGDTTTFIDAEKNPTTVSLAESRQGRLA